MNTTNLPSFLTQTGPAAFTLTLSASAAETFMLCPAKYAWSRVTGIEAASPRAGMNYGKALHLLLAARYGATAYDPAAILEAHFAKNPQPLEGGRGKVEWRTQARCFAAFQAYAQAYPAESWEVLGVEEPFEVVLGTFTVPEMWTEPSGTTYPGPANVTITVKLRGIRDLRVRWHDQIWVVDHKTMTEYGDLVADEGKASFQFMEYAWVERLVKQQVETAWIKGTPGSLPLPTGGVIGNYIIARPPYAEGRKATPRDLPRDQFERVPYPYSDAQLDEWHARAMGIARGIWDAWTAQEWRQHSTGCAHWGRCEYYQLCWETDPAWRESAAMGADYRRRTASPLDEIEAI